MNKGDCVQVKPINIEMWIYIIFTLQNNISWFPPPPTAWKCKNNFYWSTKAAVTKHYKLLCLLNNRNTLPQGSGS